MKLFNRSMVACAIAFALGWSAHALAAPSVVAAATPSGSAQPMPMGSNMAMQGMQDMQDCSKMHAMMQAQMHSPADKALMQAMMGSMHQSMMSVKLTGNADTDFMLLMIPHHQSAIAMAKVELQYGKNDRVRGLATNIISTQQEEIDEMRGWLSHS